jgi:pSer/pThr/pTyr-binding forkhead associated (FHA) protein
MIGRTDKCKVKFNDASLSRHQCIIDYIDDKWFIRDGDGEKGSTNGTWLFAEEELKLE